MAGDKSSILKYIIAILVILAINIGLGFVISKKILDYTYSTEELETSSVESDESNGETGDTSAVGTPYTVDAINLNPYNSTGEIFSCDIVLEASEGDDITEFTSRSNQIMDKLSSYLSMKTVEELRDPKQWDTFRKDMIDILNNNVLLDTKVINLFVKQKIIQYN